MWCFCALIDLILGQYLDVEVLGMYTATLWSTRTPLPMFKCALQVLSVYVSIFCNITYPFINMSNALVRFTQKRFDYSLRIAISSLDAQLFSISLSHFIILSFLLFSVLISCVCKECLDLYFITLSFYLSNIIFTLTSCF